MSKIKYFIKKYLENRPAFFALIRPQEAQLFEENKKYIKSPILDFGCGDGFFAKLVFEDQINIGLDLKDNLRVNEAIKNKIYKKIVLYDGNKIPYPDNYFQTVISNCVLEHIPNLNLSLKEIYRVLAPGGFFMTTIMTNKWENYFFGTKIFGDWYKNFMKKKQEHYNLFSEERWTEEFIKTGFEIIKTIGYLSPKTSMWIDIFHYLSLPSLISYKLFKKWILFPWLMTNSSVIRIIELNISKPVKKKESSGLFYILKK